MAMDAYAEMTDPETAQQRRDELREQLKAYCKHDTFAMVRLIAFVADLQT